MNKLWFIGLAILFIGCSMQSSFDVQSENKTDSSEPITRAAPTVPRNVKVDKVTVSTIVVTWTAPASSGAGNITYALECRANGVLISDPIRTKNRFYYFDKLKSSTTYTIYVSAVDRNGASSSKVPISSKTKSLAIAKFRRPIDYGTAYGYFSDTGADLYATEGDPVYCIKTGTVSTVYDSDTGCKTVEIMYDEPIYWNGFTITGTAYIHLTDVLVYPGETVYDYTQIGCVGLGNNEPHLHLTFMVEQENVYYVAGNINWIFDWGYNLNRDQVYELLGLDFGKTW